MYFGFFQNYFLHASRHTDSTHQVICLFLILNFKCIQSHHQFIAWTKFPTLCLKTEIWRKTKITKILLSTPHKFYNLIFFLILSLNLGYYQKRAMKTIFGKQWLISQLCIVAERDRGGRANKWNDHSSIGLIGKFSTLILSSLDSPKRGNQN